MPVIVLVGDFGAGKSSFIKGYLKKTNNEKLLYALVKNDYKIPIIRNFRDFILQVSRKKNIMAVIDEATTALPKKIPDDLTADNEKNRFIKRMLSFFINSRKLNNIVFIIYHSLREVPAWLLMYTDIVERFRTNDQLQYQISRFKSYPDLVQSLIDFPTMKNFEFDEVVLRE